MKQQKASIMRQGDVLLISVPSVPKGLKRTKRVTLALGEATGHHHSIFGGAVGFADDEEGLAKFIEVKESATLTHQEHAPIEIPAGTYEAVIQVEYTPEAIRNVAD